MKCLSQNGWDQNKPKGLLSDLVVSVLIYIFLTASIENVIEIFFLGLKNSVSAITLHMKYNTFI